jgi:hypothetical protein
VNRAADDTSQMIEPVEEITEAEIAPQPARKAAKIKKDDGQASLF